MATLTGKTALVTGGASGIGKAIAERFAEEGARVVINNITESGSKVAEAIGGAFVQADLADMEQTRSLAQQVLREHGGVDILVNNAGVQHVAPIEEFPEEEWARMLQIMLTAPFQVDEALAAHDEGAGVGAHHQHVVRATGSSRARTSPPTSRRSTASWG